MLFVSYLLLSVCNIMYMNLMIYHIVRFTQSVFERLDRLFNNVALHCSVFSVVAVALVVVFVVIYTNELCVFMCAVICEPRREKTGLPNTDDQA